MTIPGVDAIAAISIVAAVGDFSRFDDPDKLVAYVGLNPKVRQSGNSAPATAGSARPARAQVRGVLVEAAWSASRAPGPLRAFYQRIMARRGFQTAVVATARKMTVLAWHLATKDQDYAFARPALVTHKRRKLELAAGAAVTARQPPAARRRLQQQATPRPVKGRRRASRARLPGPRRPLADQETTRNPGSRLTISSVEQITRLTSGGNARNGGELGPVRPPHFHDRRVAVSRVEPGRRVALVSSQPARTSRPRPPY